MVKLVNRAKMTTATTGTGTITVGSAVDGFQTFAAAGVSNGETIRYTIEDGTNWEVGSGTYNAGTLTRSVDESSNAGSAISLSGNAIVFVTASDADIQQPPSEGAFVDGDKTKLDGIATGATAYTDSDVDTHLNTGTASSGEVLSWTGSDYDWVAVSGGATDIDGLSDAAKTSSGIYLGQNTTPSGNSVTVGTLAATQQYSIHIGSEAGRNSSGSTQSNIGIGYRALTGVSTAGDANNVAIGKSALGGYRSSANRASSSNIAIGGSTASSSTTGNKNVILGDQAASYLTTGSNNTIIGNWAARLGGITTGSGNIVIGSGASPSSPTTSNEITLGGSGITRFRIPAAGIDNTSAALSGTTPSVDVGARDTYTLTTSGNTTFTFTGAPSSGQVGTFSLIITAGGTHTLTWPASVDWAGGTAPDAPASGEKDIYTFMTVDGGTTWYGFLAGDAMA
jgi:hypothetical protein